jgi:hypothetical protein
MIRYTVVYQFLCPSCNFLMVGKFEFDAENGKEASHQLSGEILPCRVCHQAVKTNALANTFVYPNNPQDASPLTTGPLVPLI